MRKKIIFSKVLAKSSRSLAAIISVLLMGQYASATSISKSAAEKKVTIKHIQDYLNGIKTLQATILQINPNQEQLTGKVSINRDTKGTYGKLRIEYDQKHQDIVIADGQKLVLSNRITQEKTEYEIDQTPAAFLLQKKLNLQGDYTIKSFREKGSDVELTMTKFGAGDASVTLRFTTEPMLKFNGWTILDVQGNKTDVSLRDVVIGISLNPSLFQVK